MQRNFLAIIFSLLFVFPLLLLQIDGQVKTIKTSKKKSKQSQIQKSLEEKYEKEILAQIKKEQQENKPTNFYVFVGEKIEVKEFQPETEKNVILMDSAFKAKYRVIQNLYGNYNKDTIEFEVYDHYGTPPFSQYNNVLLFVSEYNGKLYHEKYQYFDVYKTKDGRWASCGDPYRFDEYHRKEFKSATLEFDAPLLFDLTEFNPKYIKAVFKEPYFKINGNKAECSMGAYVDELFTIKKEGVLKARGLFYKSNLTK